MQFVVKRGQFSCPDNLTQHIHTLLIREPPYNDCGDQLLDQHEDAARIGGQSFGGFELLKDSRELSTLDSAVELDVLTGRNMNAQPFNKTWGKANGLRCVVRGHAYPSCFVPKPGNTTHYISSIGNKTQYVQDEIFAVHYMYA